MYKLIILSIAIACALAGVAPKPPVAPTPAENKKDDSSSSVKSTPLYHLRQTGDNKNHPNHPIGEHHELEHHEHEHHETKSLINNNKNDGNAAATGDKKNTAAEGRSLPKSGAEQKADQKSDQKGADKKVEQKADLKSDQKPEQQGATDPKAKALSNTEKSNESGKDNKGTIAKPTTPKAN